MGDTSRRTRPTAGLRTSGADSGRGRCQTLAPNIDFALVALARGLALPPDAPFILFATARSAGWTAHAIEQLQTGKLIRPRARYVGGAPGAERHSPSSSS